MATLAVQNLPANGSIASLTFTAADAGLTDKFPNDGRIIVVAKNTNAATRTVTPNVKKDLGGMVTETGAPTTVPVTTGQSVLGPFDKDIFGDAAGDVTLTCSANTDLSYAVIRLPRRF